MNEGVTKLMQEAEYWRLLYRCDACGRDEAKTHIMPYIKIKIKLFGIVILKTFL